MSGHTVILVTGALGKICPRSRETQTAVYTQKAMLSKQRFGHPVLRSKPERWIPELRFAHPLLRKSL